jgi:uncharacterized protein (TIGR02217 family)
MAFLHFHDVRFPASISFGATGGPERRVEIVSLQSGREVRNLRQAHALRRYDAGTGLQAISDIEQVLAFFEARRGSFHAFRFQDPFDRKSCNLSATPSASDQTLGTGDGVTAVFKLIKTYGTGPDAYQRPISCAVASSVIVSVDSVVTPTIGFDVDAPGRSITFKAGHIPASGQVVRAGYEFDVPVRFDTDSLQLSLASFKAGAIQSIALKEVLL